MSYLVFSTPVTIATFNIQRLEGCPEKVADTIAKFDICGLQEVPGLAKLKATLNPYGNFEVLFDHSYFSYGNGIAYRKDLFRVVKTVTHVLRNKPNKKTAFEVVFEFLAGGSPPFTVVVTHLDHKSENARLAEVEKLLVFLPATTILLGDFNSLKRDDYTDEEWDAIEQSRKDTQWESCRTDVVGKILGDNVLGFQDVLGDFGKVRPTCRFDTRIDYIFVPRCDLFYVKDASVVESGDASDHKPVAARILVTR